MWENDQISSTNGTHEHDNTRAYCDKSSSSSLSSESSVYVYLTIICAFFVRLFISLCPASSFAVRLDLPLLLVLQPMLSLWAIQCHVFSAYHVFIYWLALSPNTFFVIPYNYDFFLKHHFHCRRLGFFFIARLNKFRARYLSCSTKCPPPPTPTPIDLRTSFVIVYQIPWRYYNAWSRNNRTSHLTMYI